MPNENERIASGPGLLANRFGLNKKQNNLQICIENGFWLANKKSTFKKQNIRQTTRIGISEGKDIPWRWYLENSRSISKREKGDPNPIFSKAWRPTLKQGP